MFACPNAPKLSSLLLTNVYLAPRPFIHVGHLRHLSVRFDGFWGQSNVTLTRWLDMLIALQALETLSLIYPIFSDDDTVDSERRVVHLKTLKRFSLHESVGDGTHFLQRVTIPTEAHMHLSFQTNTPAHLEDRARAASCLAKPAISSRDASVAPLRTLTLISPVHCAEPRVTFAFAPSAAPFWQPLETQKAMISVEFLDDGMAPSEDRASRFSAIVAGMKPAALAPNLHELAVDGAATAMVSALRQYEWLDTLVLCGALWPRCVEEILALGSHPRDHVLSNLRTLVLRDVPFHWLERRKLLEFLDALPIDAVHIETSTGVSQEDVEAVRGRIGVVTWDGENKAVCYDKE